MSNEFGAGTSERRPRRSFDTHMKSLLHPEVGCETWSIEPIRLTYSQVLDNQYTLRSVQGFSLCVYDYTATVVRSELR
jgi:hypothetical protein